jgi:hypothetical protein
MEKPIFSRQTSMSTNQGAEKTCVPHALSKIILKNVYRFVYPIDVPHEDIPKFKSCFDVLKTDVLQQDYNKLISEKKCGRAGYEKILLFLYLYSQVHTYSPGRCTRSDHKFTSFNHAILSTIKMKPIPDFFQFNNLLAFNRIRDTILLNSTGIEWTTFYVESNKQTIPFLRDITIPILSLGFYIYAETEFENLKRHAISIVSYDNDAHSYVMDNSWDQPNEYITDLTSFTLNSKKTNLSLLLFILPTYINTASNTIFKSISEKHFTTAKQMAKLIELIKIFEADIRAPPVNTIQPSVEPIHEPTEPNTESLPRKCWNGICSWMGRTKGGIKRKLRKTRKYRNK